jgi:hypothetical protein
MFICLQKGYAKTPTPPQTLRLDQIETNSVVIQWEEPEYNADQVENYRVVVSEQLDSAKSTTPLYNEDQFDEEKGEDEEIEEDGEKSEASSRFPNGLAPKLIEIKVGRETSIKVENLQPGTLYNAYVIAIGINPTEKSLSSDMLDFQTIGIAPKIFPYREVVNAPSGAKSAVVACRFHVSNWNYFKTN